MPEELAQNTIWAPQPGPQSALVDCPLPIIFYGGARGGGKTDGVLGKWAIKESLYGSKFNAVMFRKSTVSAEDAIERSKQIYAPLGGKFSESKLVWRMPRGGRISFKYLETVSDADQYQGRNLTDAWIEEVGQYESPEPIDRLNAVLRGGQVPKQMILTGNPGGAGQHWIRDRFELYPLPKGPRIIKWKKKNRWGEEIVIDMAVIPSRLQDNQILMQEDPEYITRLQMSGGEKLVQAWLEGDWSAIEGAFFGEWDTEKHVVEPFEVPDHWVRFGSFDWGSAKPFAMQWFAVVPDDYRGLPADSIVMYREWYGAKGVNKGLKMTAEEVADGIVKREDGEYINYRVADPAIFAEDGGPSIAERMLNRKVLFWPADNKRVARKGYMGGWDMVRSRLKGERLFFFRNCVDAIRTIPVLQHDERKPEDLDTTQEDHSADALRYACMSRPWVPAQGEVYTPPKDVWGRIKRDVESWRTV